MSRGALAWGEVSPLRRFRLALTRRPRLLLAVVVALVVLGVGAGWGGRQLWAYRHYRAALRDLSRYGTFVNEKRVAGETALSRADIIRIGSPGAELHVVDVEGVE